MYPDSGYKRAHAQSVCTRPFSRVGRGLGTRLSRTIISMWQMSLYQTPMVRRVQPKLCSEVGEWCRDWESSTC